MVEVPCIHLHHLIDRGDTENAGRVFDDRLSHVTGFQGEAMGSESFEGAMPSGLVQSPVEAGKHALDHPRLGAARFEEDVTRQGEMDQGSSFGGREPRVPSVATFTAEESDLPAAVCASEGFAPRAPPG